MNEAPSALFGSKGIHGQDVQAVLARQDLPALLTAQELEQLLQVPTSTLYVWRHRGLGPKGFRVGRRLRYTVAEVQAWIARETAA